MLWQYVSQRVSSMLTTITNAQVDKKLEEEVSLFPCFPNIRVITQVSSEEYERKQCQSNMVFVPEEMETPPLPLEYNGVRYYFDIDNTRAIRKLLESVDEDHALVFFWDREKRKYYTAGVDSIGKYEDDDSNIHLPVYVVRIRSAMVWVISVCNVLLFGYKKGAYVSGNQILKDKGEKIEKIIKDINHLANTTGSCSYSEDVWNNICDDILEAKHGTSFVIFADTNDAIEEANRLSKFKRGILTKDPQQYSDDNIRKEFLKQNSAIDGGLVFDLLGQCYAYGCIFDGTLPSDEDTQFEGTSSRGARYNSMLLYIYLKNHISNDVRKNTCLGVVFSDDYSADTIL